MLKIEIKPREKTYFTEEEKGRLNWLNWNRLAMLYNKKYKLSCEESEISYRISLNNAATAAKEGTKEELEVFNKINDSITPEIENKILKYLGKAKTRRIS